MPPRVVRLTPHRHSVQLEQLGVFATTHPTVIALTLTLD